MTLVCVPVTLDEPGQARRDAALAAERGADLVELRVDGYFSGSSGRGAEHDAADAAVIADVRDVIASCPVPAILTCRLADEGGEYDGDESDRISFFEKVCVNNEHPPAYLDVELAAYQRSANIRQKVNLCVAHPKQERAVSTRLILSMHDFEQRPPDLLRRLADAWAEPAAAVVKFAYRARSLRDNLEIFEILRQAPKPTIGLGMGEFGLMSRVLAPKFGGYLTFASLRDSTATAPGQPTIDDLLGLYRFRSIGRETRVYGVIGWPVAHSMSPLVHNAGFEAVGHDGVYLPMPVAAAEGDDDTSRISFNTTVGALSEDPSLGFAGASVTLPHKQSALAFATNAHDGARAGDIDPTPLGAANTLDRTSAEGRSSNWNASNTDAGAIVSLVAGHARRTEGLAVTVLGAGGAARAAAGALAQSGAHVTIYARSRERAVTMTGELNKTVPGGSITTGELDDLPGARADVFINATPLGMTGSPSPDAIAFPIDEMTHLASDTVFFDTVYHPIDTPLLRAARDRGCRTIDGVEMFVRQAEAQFALWTKQSPPAGLFDRLVRERLSAD